MRSELALGERVCFCGPLFGRDKWDAYDAADVFVLPTHSENSGLVILEALQARVPVITTTGAPWAMVEGAGCGWWTQMTADGLAAALSEAMSMDALALRAMGARGAAWVDDRYGERLIIGMRSHLYAWLLGREARPEFVMPGT